MHANILKLFELPSFKNSSNMLKNKVLFLRCSWSHLLNNATKIKPLVSYSHCVQLKEPFRWPLLFCFFPCLHQRSAVDRASNLQGSHTAAHRPTTAVCRLPRSSIPRWCQRAPRSTPRTPLATVLALTAIKELGLNIMT